MVELTQNTIEANARFFENEAAVPKKAITMGIGCIMATRRVLLVASGANKAEAVYRTVCGPITPQCPASILQLHNDVVIVGDEEALSMVREAGVEICR